MTARISALPGKRLTLGITLLWLGVVVLVPLAALALRPWQGGGGSVWATLSDGRVLAALRLSFGAALLAALIDVPLGLLLVYAVVRLRFPGRKLLDAAIDLPFALPTAVAGIALAALAAPNGWLGAPVMALLGWKIAFTRAGIVYALMFTGLPFIVRTTEPVLRDLHRDAEEAAATLGATRGQTISRVLLPALAPALLTGFGLAFARAVGEYGSVIFIAGNLPRVTEIAPLLIVIRLEEYDDAGAAAVGLAMLVMSFAVLLGLNLLQRMLRANTP
jgi:sulfate transport system permease protein